MRSLISVVGILVLVHHAGAQTPSLQTQVVLATYRLENPKTSGTGFVVRSPDPVNKESDELLLVTAAHVFEKMEGNRATLVLRKKMPTGDWTASPMELAIRQDEKPLWHRHTKHDVAVMRLTTPTDTSIGSVPLTCLASAKDWQSDTIEPGALIRCVGFPHAAQFKPSPAAFPLTRLGCIASYPLTPDDKDASFLVDYNTFEGDSGGPVYFNEPGGSVKIIGLVQGQHLLDERFKTIYQEGMTRKRLGLAIIVNSQAILETIESLPDLESFASNPTKDQ